MRPDGSFPYQCAAPQLRLNFSTSAVGSVRVEIGDKKGRALPGFALDDMDPLYGDQLDAPISWKGGGDLSALIGTPVRLRFELRDADVFSLRFTAPDAGGQSS